jgi:hypothetical protein
MYICHEPSLKTLHNWKDLVNFKTEIRHLESGIFKTTNQPNKQTNKATAMSLQATNTEAR